MNKIITSSLAPAAIGPYCQAVETDGFIFVSGQLPIDASTGEMKQGIEEQTRQSLNNILYILEAAGSNMDKIVKTTVLLKDMNDFGKMNEVYASFFNSYPARACYQVAKLPKDALVEIECIAKK